MRHLPQVRSLQIVQAREGWLSIKKMGSNTDQRGSCFSGSFMQVNLSQVSGPHSFSIRTLVWMPESWWSWVFSFLVRVLPVPSKPEPDLFPPHLDLKRVFVLLWGFLTFVECLELSWITQTSVFVLKDFKKLTKDSQFYRPYFHRPPNLPRTTSASQANASPLPVACPNVRRVECYNRDASAASSDHHPSYRQPWGPDFQLTCWSPRTTRGPNLRTLPN